MEQFRNPAAVRRRVHVRDPFPLEPTREGQDLRERRTADDRSVVRQPFLRDVDFFQRIPAPQTLRPGKRRLFIRSSPVRGDLARVELRGLTKTYDGAVAVKELDLEIKDKEFVVLLGPSGCGKTTTLRCVAGLESPEAGEIYIGDRLVNDLDPKERNIAMVFQNYALYPHMTVYKNLAFPLENRRLPAGEVDRRVRRTAKLLQIERLLGRKPAQLNGGQQQRVAVGRAIVRGPQALLMAEPPSNLEPESPLPADLAAVAGRASSDQVVLGIRPQDIRVSLQASEEPCVCTETFATEPLGDQTILDLKLGEALMKAIVVPDFPAEMGTEVWVSFPAPKIHFFDKKTGKALV